MSQAQIPQHRIIPFAGKATFALNRARKRAIQYLQKNGLFGQIQLLPESYPIQQGQIKQIESAARAKILKAHLEDAFPQNIFSVRLTRKKKHCILTVTHDTTEYHTIREIACLYSCINTRIVILKDMNI